MAQTTMQKYFDYVRNRYGDKGVPSNFQHWLDLEKQQIIDAWNDGHSDGWNVRENHYNPNYYKKSNGAEWYNYEFNYKYGQLKTSENKVNNSEIPNN